MSDSVDRDFNNERPRTFRIRDETFQIRPVRPEEYAEMLRRGAEIETQALEPGGGLNLIYAGWDDRILQSIDPAEGGHDRWRALRARADESVTMVELKEILSWLTEVHTGRPLQWAEPSSAGPGSSEPLSTAESSSPEVVRPA